MDKCVRCNEKVSKLFQKQIMNLDNLVLCSNCYNEIIYNVNEWLHNRLALFEIKKWLNITFEWQIKFSAPATKEILLRYGHNIFMLFLRVYKRSFARSLGLDIPDVTNIYETNKSEVEDLVDKQINRSFDMRFEKVNNQTYKFIIFSDRLFSVKDYLEHKFSIDRVNEFLCEKNKIDIKKDFSAFLLIDDQPFHRNIKGCLNVQYSIKDRIRYYLLDRESEDEFFNNQSFINFFKKINNPNFIHNVIKDNSMVLNWINNTIKIYSYEKSMFKMKLLDIVKM